MTKDDYNNEPVVWCDKCCSLNITVNWVCKNCGNDDPTQMTMGTIGEFENAYKKMHIKPHLGWNLSDGPYDDLTDVYASSSREVCTYQEAFNNKLRLTQGKPF